MKEVKFKVGDKVYCPLLGTGIYQIEYAKTCVKNPAIQDHRLVYFFDETGNPNMNYKDSLPFIFHATAENYELLSKLYPNVTFEPPPKRKEPKEVIEAMLESGKWYLVNYRGYGKIGNPPKNKSVTKEQFKKMDMNNYFNKNAFVNVEVFCPNTGKTIIDFVNGEVVLEGESYE